MEYFECYCTLWHVKGLAKEHIFFEKRLNNMQIFQRHKKLFESKSEIFFQRVLDLS